MAAEKSAKKSDPLAGGTTNPGRNSTQQKPMPNDAQGQGQTEGHLSEENDRGATGKETVALDPSSSPPRQTSPTGGGEHKSSNDKSLDSSRQLVTDVDQQKKETCEAAARMLNSPSLAEQIIDDVHQLGVVGEGLLILITYVVATARLLARAIQLCVHGPSSSGKSLTVGKVLDLFSPEEVYRTTQVTPKHLLNLKEDEARRYRHKVIFIGELTTGEGDLAFREMAESGRVRNLTVRDGVAQESFADGPITFITTMTLLPNDIKDEDSSRLFYFATDDSMEQTRRVMEARATRAKNPSPPDDPQGIIAKHHVAQRVLGKHADTQIVIPYSDLIQLPAEDPHSRRLHDRILVLLEAVTFLGQLRKDRRREKKDGVTLVYADEQDWKIALPLIEVIVAQKYGLPDQASKGFVEKLRPLGSGQFSIKELSDQLGLSESTVRRRIDRLPTGWCTTTWDSKKLLYEYHLDNRPTKVAGLPSYEEVRTYLRSAGELASNI